MEQKEILLKDQILEIPNFLDLRTLVKFLKYINKLDSENKFADARIIGKNATEDQQVVKNIRDTRNFCLTNLNDSKTDQHWCNLMIYCLQTALQKYQKDRPECYVQQIIDIQILKYKQGGHYISHIDDHPDLSRTVSFIYRLNNDYEGGDLVWELNGKEFHRSKTKANSLVLWPSNFLYPHKVEPVTKGLRWSMVAWGR
jgi:Rps23 Pro-64 3,4-dihydroxylase Tpa1-like proline 4-hydroxylase